MTNTRDNYLTYYNIYFESDLFESDLFESDFYDILNLICVIIYNIKNVNLLCFE